MGNFVETINKEAIRKTKIKQFKTYMNEGLRLCEGKSTNQQALVLQEAVVCYFPGKYKDDILGSFDIYSDLTVTHSAKATLENMNRHLTEGCKKQLMGEECNEGCNEGCNDEELDQNLTEARGVKNLKATLMKFGYDGGEAGVEEELEESNRYDREITNPEFEKKYGYKPGDINSPVRDKYMELSKDYDKSGLTDKISARKDRYDSRYTEACDDSYDDYDDSYDGLSYNYNKDYDTYDGDDKFVVDVYEDKMAEPIDSQEFSNYDDAYYYANEAKDGMDTVIINQSSLDGPQVVNSWSKNSGWEKEEDSEDADLDEIPVTERLEYADDYLYDDDSDTYC